MVCVIQHLMVQRYAAVGMDTMAPIVTTILTSVLCLLYHVTAQFLSVKIHMAPINVSVTKATQVCSVVKTNH